MMSGFAKAPLKKCLKSKKCTRCLKKCDKINPEKKRGGRSYWKAREHWECGTTCFHKHFPRKKRTMKKRSNKKKQRKTAKKTPKNFLEMLFNL